MKVLLQIALFTAVLVNNVYPFCDNVIPGLVKLTKGVDITLLEVTPLDNTEDDGYRRAVIDLSCVQQKKWTNPYNPAVIYNLPDQVETANALPGGVLDAILEVYKNYKDLKTTRSAKLGISLVKGMFSSSASYKRAQELTTNSSRRVGEVTAYFSATQMDLLPYWESTLSKSGQAFIEKVLPADYKTNEAKYQEFFERFGTHYYSSGKFGGLFMINLEIEESLLQTMSSTEIGANAKGTFFNILKAKGGYSGATTKISEQFSSKTRVTTRYYGGSANLFDVDSWQSWWPTVPGNPWLFGGKLDSILTLIPDGSKKTGLVTAHTIYLDKAYLEELRRTIYSFLGKGYAGEATVKGYLDRLNALYNDGATNHAAIQNLGTEVTNYILTADWFNEDTALCFNWYPDGDGGQCGGGAPSRHLCAKPNALTPFYRDDTDSRGGGCRMSWGIESPVTVPWFKKVQICFRWHPDGDGGQCGGGAPREMCAPVGQYTQEYRDDTDRRPGGCQMSWRLLVPAEAPGWMLNTKLCFSWYPDGDGGQCSGSDRNLCARANEWTPYYRDDTDRRAGGCQMAWGFKTYK